MSHFKHNIYQRANLRNFQQHPPVSSDKSQDSQEHQHEIRERDRGKNGREHQALE